MRRDDEKKRHTRALLRGGRDASAFLLLPFDGKVSFSAFCFAACLPASVLLLIDTTEVALFLSRV